jgi:ferritin
MELISQKTIDILNLRIQQEQMASKLYEQMYLWLENKSLINSAEFMQKNYLSELEHAGWAKEYLLSFDIMPELATIEEPANDFASLQDIFNKVYEQEVLTTKQCLELAKHSMDEPDYNLLTLAQKFNAEQVHEMREINDILSVLKLSSDLLIVDHYIGDVLNKGN